MSTPSDSPPLPSLVCAIGSETTALSDDDIRSQLGSFLQQLGPKDDIFLLPPDFTRYHSQSGKITKMIAEYYKFINYNHDDDDQEEKQDDSKTLQIMPALGTHKPMTQQEIQTMFGKELASTDPSPFLVHDWRNDVETIGYAPEEMVSKATRGMVSKPWPAQLNKKVWEKRYQNLDEHAKNKTVVISIGQVVPHEVMGMANFNKNLFVGVGGLEAINLSHFIGAVYGMENMMGRSSNPLREILNFASKKYLESQIELWYILTVIGPATSSTNTTTKDNDIDGDTSKQPPLEMKGLFIGKDIQCYEKACELSLKVNFTMLEKPPQKIVVYLDESEFHSTWLGNKSIYRTRMAIADGGELIVLAPGLQRFGEDDEVDKLIRKYGYVGTPKVMEAMKDNEDLKDSLGTVAHLIHGSTEGRFSVTYCPGSAVTKEEIESVGFNYSPYEEMKQKYDPSKLKDGWQTTSDDDGGSEEFFYISNPALGLWAVQSRFKADDDEVKADNQKEEEGERKKPRLE